jgi:NAD(P)H-nitrite reductase large subunit
MKRAPGRVDTVVIAGAGLAGARAAETLRAEGFDGRVVLVGEEPVAPYERPALSKEFLAGARGESSLLLRPVSFWDEVGIELLLGERVESVDAGSRRVTTGSGLELGFDALVVATGARPRRLPLELPAGTHTLRTLAHARALREELLPGRRLAVVGGGFVGAEVASIALSLGLEVTIVEAACAPLARVLGDEAGLLLADRWRRYGVEVRLGAAVAGFQTGAGGRVEAIRLSDGGEVAVDVILIATGVEPAGELLPVGSPPHIHPAGDVVGPGHWTSAALGGAAAARRILGLPALAPRPEYVWSDQFGLRLQIIGSPGPDHILEVEGGEDSFALRFLTAGGTIGAAVLANRPTEAAAVRRALADAAQLPCAA